MNARAAQDHPNPRRTGIDLRHHLRFLVRGTSDHEDNNVLRLVAGRSPAFNKRVLLLFQPGFDQVLERGFHSWGVLSVDILDPLQTSESVARSRKNGGGLEEIGETSGRGRSLERMVIGKKLGYNFYSVRRDVAGGSQQVK